MYSECIWSHVIQAFAFVGVHITSNVIPRTSVPPMPKPGVEPSAVIQAHIRSLNCAKIRSEICRYPRAPHLFRLALAVRLVRLLRQQLLKLGRIRKLNLAQPAYPSHA